MSLDDKLEKIINVAILSFTYYKTEYSLTLLWCVWKVLFPGETIINKKKKCFHYASALI